MIDNHKIYLKYFQAFEESLNGERNSNIHKIRLRAIEQFAKLGFPTPRDEEYRFTNLKPIEKIQFVPAYQFKTEDISKEDLNKFSINQIDGYKFVFLNGKYSSTLSNTSPSKRIRIIQLTDAIKTEDQLLIKHLGSYADVEKNPFTALNTSFLFDGIFIHIPDNTEIDKPIHLIYFTTNAQIPLILHPRNLIIIGKNSRASIIEHFIGINEITYFMNSVTEIFLDENAKLEHNIIQTESNNAFHVGSIYVQQSLKSCFTSNSIIIGGLLTRNNIYTTLNGEGIECILNGLSLASGNQLIDNHTSIDHAKPDCSSRELYKAVLDGKAKGVFNGKIYVRKQSQKTDAKQTNKALLLSDDATMNTKPQLEIFADDVKCTHGAAIGYLDADSLFYLRSRGISEDIARDILTYAFANDIIERITIESIKDYLHDILFSRFKQARVLTT